MRRRLSAESGETEKNQNPLSKPHRDRVRGLAQVNLLLPTASLVTNLRRTEGEIENAPIWTTKMVSDTGCERIHKQKKVQKDFYFYFPKRGKELGAEICTSTSPEGLGLWAFLRECGGCGAGCFS